MPVYLLTFHAYRSWSEDHPKGYVQRGKRGVQASQRGLKAYRDRIAKHDRVQFNRGQQRVIVDAAGEICERLAWRLHAAAATATHAHLLVSWQDGEEDRITALTCGARDFSLTCGAQVRAVSTRLKRIIGMKLSRQCGTKGSRWFSCGCDEQPVKKSSAL